MRKRLNYQHIVLINKSFSRVPIYSRLWKLYSLTIKHKSLFAWRCFSKNQDFHLKNITKMVRSTWNSPWVITWKQSPMLYQLSIYIDGPLIRICWNSCSKLELFLPSLDQVPKYYFPCWVVTNLHPAKQSTFKKISGLGGLMVYKF